MKPSDANPPAAPPVLYKTPGVRPTHLGCLTPSLYNFRVEKCSYTSANSILDGFITNLLSVLRILIPIISSDHGKGEKAIMI